MLNAEFKAALQPLKDAIAALEARAGIEAQAAAARLGSLSPAGWLGGPAPATPEEHRADKADHERHGLRRAYFAIQDVELRKELIAAVREYAQTEYALLRKYVAEAGAEAARQNAAARRHPWYTALLIAAACTLAGWLSGPGDLGTRVGAIVGCLLGFLYVGVSRKALDAAVRESKELWQIAVRELKFIELWPEVFNQWEEDTGTEEHAFSAEVALDKVRHFLALERSRPNASSPAFRYLP